MSDFKQVSDWVDAHLADNGDKVTITKELLLELQAMADNENETLSKRAFNILTSYHRQDGMRALSSIRLNTHQPKAEDYRVNSFAIVLLKSDPHSTDGIFIILQVVPERYVLKTVIRCDSNYVTTSVTHTYFNLFESAVTKEYMKTGTGNGECQKDIFVQKRKHDNFEPIDPEFKPGTNEPFTITKPNGETYQP